MKIMGIDDFPTRIHYLEEFINTAMDVIGKIEELRKTRVFLLFIGNYRSIDTDLPEIIYDLLPSVKGDLDVILYTSGGSGDQAYLVGRYLQENVEGRLSFLVPRWAKSAGTLLSCSGDEIVMTRIAELGPIDPMIHIEKIHRYVPVLSIIELFKILPQLGLPDKILKDIIDKLPLIEIGDYKRVLEHNIELTSKLLEKRMFRDDPGKASKVASSLASYKHHGAPITLYDASELGLRVRRADPVLEEYLLKLHSSWRDQVLEFEDKFLLPPAEPINIKIGDRGVVLTNIQDELLRPGK